MIAVVAGGTGLVGSEVIQQLLKDSRINQVRAVTRKSVGVEHAKLKEVFVSDLAELPKFKDELRGDIYFCCLGTTIKKAGSQEAFRKIDHDGVLNFARVAKANDAKSLVVISAMGANADSKIFYNRVKGEMERDLSALGFSSLTIFRPALLMGDRKEFRLAEKVASAIAGPLSSILPESVKKASLTDAEVLAKRAVEEAISGRAGIHVIKSKQI
jgi:uncharacterized protein YbjT (DUF2867 family)